MQAAEATPDLASVTFIVQVTFWSADDTLTLVGLSDELVSAGAITSGSEVTLIEVVPGSSKVE
jgi:hypothetical protein